MTNNLRVALYYRNKLGYSVIPVNNLKKPLIKWEEFQKRVATEEEIKEWYEKYPDANVGVVTGLISGIAVIDLDEPEVAKPILNELIPDSLVFPIADTPSGGEHWYFKCTDADLRNNARLVAGADLRANGGYVVVPPSKNGNGKSYAWRENLKPTNTPLVALPALYKDYILNINNNIYNNNSFYKENADCRQNLCRQESPLSSSVVKMFQEGTRDNDLFHVANCLYKGKMKEENISQVLEILANNCNPPFPVKEIQEKIMSAKKRGDIRIHSLADDVREFVESSSGTFLSSDIVKCLQLSSRDEVKNVSKILSRLVNEKVIEKYGNKNGHWRKIETEENVINWMQDESHYLNIELPFGITQLVNIMPKNILVCAGSPNSGKTAFLLNCVKVNMAKHNIVYFSSEMGDFEMKDRLSKFDIPLKEWRFRAIERSNDFADVIRPDDINIIDFMEIHEDFWRIGGMMKAIHDKLNKGIAIIALQKNHNSNIGRGGVGSLEKPRLYLSMDAGKISIEKGKNWATDRNPNGLFKEFSLVQGCKFVEKSDWRRRDAVL